MPLLRRALHPESGLGWWGGGASRRNLDEITEPRGAEPVVVDAARMSRRWSAVIALSASNTSTFAMSETGPQCIPLPLAVLCINCESITVGQHACPSCGSHELHPLSTWLGTTCAA